MRTRKKAMEEAKERGSGKLGLRQTSNVRQRSKDSRRPTRNKEIKNTETRNKKDRESRTQLDDLECERKRSRQTKRNHIPSSQLTPKESETCNKKHRERMQAYRAAKPTPKLKQKKKLIAKDARDYQVLVCDFMIPL